ncbi:type I polyketide synthase [Acetivibrio cellulolyticus]|uniref:type I polyketide synthase n=1 Tax=Acetivibrio cellulolyticus TaxID=35830 RepID=UPI0001E2EBF5|nr:type I polyketide synthase [Acetivibrio cellulolyticus]
MNKYYYPEERIAVVAMGGYFPDAIDLNTFWNNIITKRVSIRDIPEEYFNGSIYYRPEVFGKSDKKDKSYTKIAAVARLDDYLHLCRKYKIPPTTAEQMDPNQHVAMLCVDQALSSLKSVLPKERTAVIFGTGAPGIQNDNIIRRVFFQEIEDYLRNKSELGSKINAEQLDEIIGGLSQKVLKNTIPITEDSAPGMLQNITAARISNIFDFHGPSFTVDAACASTLTAASLGISGLLNHEYDAVITGAAEVSLSEPGFVAFSGINALSPVGSYPFDERANGFVMGFGGGVLVLKRLGDALRDQDNIIALISGYGQGSDGKGKAIAAPSEEGQVRVIQAAARMADYPIDTVELIEAHGTGTIVGDVIEISALKKAFQGLGATKQNYCGVSSVKSNIGHLRTAAGAPSLIKTAFALHNKILPPVADVQRINPKLQLEGSPFYILTEQKHWQESKEHPRRAGVSSYGFGGSDFHIAMEEYRTEFLPKIYPLQGARKVEGSTLLEVKNSACNQVVFFSGDTLDEINASYSEFCQKLNSQLQYGQAVFLNNAAACAKKEWRAAISAKAAEELKEKWDLLMKSLNEGKMENLSALQLKGIYFGKGEPISSDKMALMFPGQASQYPDMLREIRDNYSAVEVFYMQADAMWKAKYGYPLMPVIFGDNKEQLEKELKNTKNTHPAMFLSNIAIYKMLSECGVKADYMIGHSLGEITALYAAGMLDLKSAIELVGARGFSFDGIPESERGRMVSVKAEKIKVAEMIQNSESKVSIANINSLEQTVVGGSDNEVNKFVEYLSGNNIAYTVLKVSHAFHTDLTERAADSFYNKISNIEFDASKTKVMACHLVDFYPGTREQLKDMPNVLKSQILSSVNFVDSIKKLYDLGVRLFIETGPSTVLTNLVRSILQDSDVKVISTNNRKKDSVEAYQCALAELFAYGVDLCTIPTKETLGLTEIKTISVQKVLEEAPEAVKPVNMQQIAINSNNQVVMPKESLVYSGVSIGLPGSFKKVFSDENFKYLLEGKNLIEMLTDDEMQSMLDLNITRLIKTESGSTYKSLTAINEVIQLAGKFGKIDMLNDYLVDEKTIRQMTFAVCAGVAAGYEALKDAGIPLVQEQIKTSSGHYLPGRYVLPEEMQEDTGIIFANGFLMIEPFIEETSKFIASKFGAKTRNDLIHFYEGVVTRISDPNSRKILTDWFTIQYSRLLNNCGEEDIYKFNHEFMSQISSRANNRLAQFIGAKGPNFHLSAACSSTVSAVTLAEDLIRSGHAKRMIIIGAENPGSKAALPWMGASFLSTGSATDSGDVYEAAVPFDNRRNGMILGSGAVGLVIEKESDVSNRGMDGICRIIGTHMFNTAGHQVKIDGKEFSIQLDRFLNKMESEHGINRNTIAPKTVYYSHETYSPRKGGCSIAEKQALHHAFGEKFRELKVINTKGMTGHTLGASIEEAVAAKCLQYQKIPPVVNYREPDPELEGLNLSEGGNYNFDYILRIVAGYGAQGNFHLLQKLANGDNRFSDKNKYQQWLANITSSEAAELKNMGRILIAEGNRIGIQRVENNLQQPSIEREETISAKVPMAPQQDKVELIVPKADTLMNASIKDEILNIYSSVTKYPKDMLDLSMEMEADLGIDTVKQATIFSMISDKFNLAPEQGVRLSNYPTIGDVVNLICQMNGSEEQAMVEKVQDSVETGNSSEGLFDCSSDVFQVISEITKYPADMLDRDMEMEADLGIDTVKQATIFSILGQKYGVSEEMSKNVSMYRTIDSVIKFIEQNQKTGTGKSVVGNSPEEKNRTSINKAAIETVGQSKTIVKNTELKEDSKSINHQVLALISEITKYPKDMLELEMEMEADLGIDTVKQATIFSMIGDKFEIGKEKFKNISQYKTIGAIINMIEESLDNNVKADDEVLKVNNAESDITYEDELIKTDDDSKMLSLHIPVFVEEALGVPDYEIKDKNIWLLGDDDKTVQRVLKHFKEYSYNVNSFVFEKNFSKGELEGKIAQFVKNPVDVIVDCTHLGGAIEFDKMTGDEEEQMLFLSSEARFYFYKKLSEVLAEPQLRILCLVNIDGCHGYANEQEINDPFYGAIGGFYKGLRKEWPKSSIKVIDLGCEQVSDIPEESMSNIVKEAQESSLDYEIGYQNGERKVLKIDIPDRAEYKNIELPEKPHFLITGGGYGITAEIVKGLCQRFNGGKFTILGRTQLPENVRELSQLDENALEQKKTQIHSKLKEEGKKVTPALVQSEFDKIVKANSIYQLIDYVEKAGGKALYVPCDVRNYDSMKGAMQEALNQNGAVHIAVYAAGIEKSRLIKQKTYEEFKEVFSVKAQGLCNLYRLLDLNDLKAFVGFSSVSGRFGNEAQLDYCSANNFINSFMGMIKSKYKSVHALSIAWSGWKDTGMAWRNEFVKNHSEELGLHLIEVKRGTEAFVELLTNGINSHEVIVSNGLRHFAHNGMMKCPVEETPLLDWVSKTNGKYDKGHKVLSVKTDPIIDQHRLGTTPIMPAVGFLEMCAEFHSINFGRKEQYCFRNVKLNNGLKLYHENPQEVILTITDEPKNGSFSIASHTYLKSKFGITNRIELNSMEVSDKIGDYLSLLEIRNIENETMEMLYQKDMMYEYNTKIPNSIHVGPLFMSQVKEDGTIKRGKNGVVYSTVLPPEQISNKKYQLDKLLINPAFMDSVFQVCAIHTLIEIKRVYLPWQIEELGVVKVPKEPCQYKAYSKITNESDDAKTYDVIFLNENDEVCYYAKNVVMKRINL